MAATDLERLVLVLEANTSSIDRQLKKFNGTVDKSMRRAAKSTGALDRALAGATARLGTLAAAFVSAHALRGAQQLVDAATRVENALKVAGLSGDELTRVYDRLFEAAQENAAPLETLVTLYGRAALVQKELGVSTEELLGFTDKVAMALRVAGTDAGAASGALLQLSQALGSGTVRAEEFNSILEGALPIAQAAAAGLEEAGGSVAKLRALVVDGKVSSEAFFRAFEAGAVILEDKVASAEFTVSHGFNRLNNVLIRVAGELDKATGASDSAGDALNTLAVAVEALGDFMVRVANGPIGTFIGKIGELDSAARSVLGVLSKFSLVDEIGGAIGGVIAPEAELTEDAIKAYAARNGIGQGGTKTTPKTSRLVPYPTVSLSDFTVPSSGGGGGSGGASAARKQATADLREAEKAARDFEQAELDAARAAEDMGSAIGGAVGNLASAFADGKLEAHELLGIVTQLAQQLIRLSDSKGFGGGFLSSLLGSFGGFFADGGRLGAGKWGVAGEAGPELISGPANITPMGSVNPPSVSRAASSPSVVINAPINAPGADAAALARVEQSVKELGRSIPKMIDSRNQERQVRGVRA